MSDSSHSPSRPDSKLDSPSTSRNESRRQYFVLLGCTLLCIRAVSYLFTIPNPTSTPQPDSGTAVNTTFDWNNVIPSTNLEWHNCFPNRQCARLAVPLDYNDAAGDKAAIALIRIKAKVLPTSTNYRGPILFNPGGPGGSGVEMINETGELYQKILGAEYDIVGFDPRGVGLTTPAVSVFLDPYERAYWDAGAPPLMNSTSFSFLHAYTRSELFGKLSMKRTQHAAQFVGTATVARDMFTITRSHGRDKLLYWGFSYGSVLGATYAALFPDNIDRLVIDGVVDFDDYYSGNWSKNLEDTDRVLHWFYQECAAAGPACPLYANSSSSVQRRVENVLATIKSKPLPVVDDTTSGYSVLDYTMVKNDLFRALYYPFSHLTRYAHVLAALELGNGRPALAYWQKYHPQPKCNTEQMPSDSRDAGIAIRCGEGEGAGREFEDIARQFEHLSTVSVFADIWVDLTRTECAGWKVKAKDRYGGPFNTTTSFPLLIVGNTADPVTPLRGAQKAAQGFKGSSLLTINTPGHCSLAVTSPSAMGHIRRYFREGKIPPAETICEIEDTLFGKKLSNVATLNDKDIIDATRLLSRHFGEMRARDGYLL